MVVSGRIGFVQHGLHIRFLFASRAAEFGPPIIRRRQPRGLVKPAGEDRFGAERGRSARKDDEHRLCNLLGGVGIARLPQCDGIDEIHVPLHEKRERGFGVLTGELRQQLIVVLFGHPVSNVRRTKKGTGFFGLTAGIRFQFGL